LRIQQKMLKNPLLILAIYSLTSLSACSSTSNKLDNNSIASDTSPQETAQQPIIVSLAEPESKTESHPAMQQSAVTESSSVASPAELNPVAVANIRETTPREYRVKSGDTLWGIAGHFLNDPWYWPELWAKNPQINNPHLIFPGDIISLIYVNGQPVFQVSRNGELVNSSAGIDKQKEKQVETSAFERVYKKGPLKQVKLSPRIRSTDLKESIKTIPNDAIEQFTTKPQVVTIDQWQEAPYIIGSDDKHLILSQGNRIYIRGELDRENLRYNIYRKGAELIDPASGDLLGYEIIYAGEASITKYDSPASGRIVKSTREVIIGDRLLATDHSELNNLFFPKPPEEQVEGQIISLFDAISSIAQYQVAVVNLGKRDGVTVGNILSTYTQGESVRDRFERREGKIKVKLPNERSGMIMLFKTFDRVSYGLILEASRVIKRNDVVRTPYK